MITRPTLQQIMRIAGRKIFDGEFARRFHERARLGFDYDISVIRGGKLIDHEEIHNLFPTAALNDLISVYFKNGTQKASWYVGIFEGDYTPLAADTAATFVASATECTAYTSATRPALTLSTPASGSANNTADRAEFVMSSAKTVYGAFIQDNSAKSSTTTLLASAAKFSAAKSLETDDTLLVGATLTLSSS